MVTTDVQRGQGAYLSDRQKVSLRRFAQVAVLAATIFSGVTIALQIAMLAPYPGTSGDPIMRTFSFLVMFAVLGTALKTAMVPFVGPRIERKLGTNRPVKLRYVFNREIWTTAFWGGLLNAIYSMLFVFMAPFLAPTALAASRACIVLALVPVEWFAGVLERGDRRMYWRLSSSVVVTLAGAAIVIFAHGFELFKGTETLYLWVVFIALLGPGNFILALAELAEMHGVHKQRTPPAIYTLARFMMFALACITAVVIRGLTHDGFGIFWNVLEMMAHRWYFWVPVSLLWALTDLVRICVKTVVPATYMYVVLSLAVAIDAITQTIAKYLAPDIYTAVPSGWAFLTASLLGGLVVAAGTLLWPHKREPSPAGTIAAT